MARSQTRMAAIALGLIIGGAIGNAIDSLAYGAVVDFALFHVQIGEKDLQLVRVQPCRYRDCCWRCGPAV